ncbi:hypothetical protein BDF20DRAFT_655427 [Mycotypha africana]|uniref:uncharacterized protein n=1 Tax=Mycotypha africana TaxID=64632 RepID=UPI0022FFC66B|nr:uncharacterized protein BDF20DRAFT_655427 [Mycotypha africana]KAI8973494.1 hypothetical protein BDF20DRAFT_655427 [Mycotypha africana]
MTEETCYDIFLLLLKHASQNEGLEGDIALYCHRIADLHKQNVFKHENSNIFITLLNFIKMLCYEKEEVNENEKHQFNFDIPFNNSERLFSLIGTGIKACEVIISDEEAVDLIANNEVDMLCCIIPTVIQSCMANVDHKAAESVILVRSQS